MVIQRQGIIHVEENEWYFQGYTRVLLGWPVNRRTNAHEFLSLFFDAQEPVQDPYVVESYADLFPVSQETELRSLN